MTTLFSLTVVPLLKIADSESYSLEDSESSASGDDDGYYEERNYDYPLCKAFFNDKLRITLFTFDESYHMLGLHSSEDG